MEFVKLFGGNEINLEVLTKVLPTKGNLVYEYNPFRNYRITQNMYEYKGQLYSLGDLWKNFKISINCSAKRYKINNIYEYVINGDFTDDGNIVFEEISGGENFGKWIEQAYEKGHNADRRNLESALIKSKINNAWYNVPETETDPYLRESGELCDFISDELNFSLNHPVHIIPQYSYDGSVNLIINDGINVPRLINSRFSATGKNTYEVIDRKGNNDTNIYDLGELFDIDTSLYKRVIKIPKIDFRGVSAGGNLRVGNYHFYFKLSDADGNETDFVGESGLVSVFIGFNDYFSVTTGLKNENSFKLVNFLLTNIDSSYDYVTVYFSRSTAEGTENAVTSYTKIDKKYPVNNASIANIVITGFENMINITATDINLNYNIVDSVNTSAVCLNMLFLANVHKPDIPYNELLDLSLRFLPYLKQEEYTVDVDLNYAITTTNRGYLDPLFIYNKTGYWGKEIYRFGIVYILNNGELSPVFNVRGGYDIEEFKGDDTYIDEQYSNIPVWKDGKRLYINYHEEKYTILQKDGGVSLYENVKGVVTFKPSKDTNTIYSVDFRVDDETIQELKKLVRGYFFVRQTRIPTILALGITIGIDKESHTPTIPTADGFLTDLSESLSKTHVTTEDINDVNFISEGFLSRYSFKFEKKSSGLFGSILKGIAIGVGVVALAAATVFTAGAAGAIAAGATIAGAASAGATALATTVGTIAATVGIGAGVSYAGTVGIIVGTTAAAAGLGVAAAGGILELRYGVASIFAKKKLDGRNTKAPAGYKIVETEDSRKIDLDFLNRFIPKDASYNTVSGIICPDYSLNLPYYNQIFTGNTHLIELTNSLNINCLNGHSTNYFTNNERHFYVPSYYDRNVNTGYSFKIIGVSDGVKCIGIDNMLFRAKAGEAEEAWRYECIAEDYKSDKSKTTGLDDSETQSNKKINTDIIRGNFGPYLAFNDDSNKFLPAETVNIYIPEYSTTNMEEYFYLRMVDSSTFHAITDRFDFLDIDDKLIVPLSTIVGQEDRTCGYHINAYRGDCYICLYTHRVVRNFNDPSAPYNDDIVDENTWKDNYDPDNTEKYEQINLGDVNAVQIGMWITFKLRSSNNLNIRTLDSSYVDETAMQGHPRGYYPYHPMSVEGSYKHPESEVYNKGFSKSVSERWNVELPDVPHIKNWFKTRIMYSDIHINDAYKNGFRVFLGTNYRDYTREYGEIVKLVPFESSLLCVFEHGIALIPVNERAVAGQGAGGNVYINTSNVLPENPKIISDMFGSLWPESVLKVPGRTGDAPQYVYGVDTVAKKIWRTDGTSLECISDFKVQEFLNNNITLGEREITPKIGIRNVKTVYNAFKRDVMFTFYDNTYGFEEKVWNLCWNELLQKFITFYSWVPSYMENINNIPFSFDRNTSKWIAKLGVSHAENSFADGITLSNNIITAIPEYKESIANGITRPYYSIDVELVNNFKYKYTYISKSGELIEEERELPKDKNFIGVLSLSNRILPDDSIFYNIEYHIEHDIYGNYKNFYTKVVDTITLNKDAKFEGNTLYIWGLFFKEESDPMEFYSELYYRNSEGLIYADLDENHKLLPNSNIMTYKQGVQLKYGVNIFGTRLNGTSSFPDNTVVGVISLVDGKIEFSPCNASSYSDPYYTIKHVKKELDYGYVIGEDGHRREGEDWFVHGSSHTALDRHYTVKGLAGIHFDKPIFIDGGGRRVPLPRELLVNPEKLVTLLNIKASIVITDNNQNLTLSDYHYNKQAQYNGNTIDMGYYESVVAITSKWNLQFLSTDFWKHGQAGIFNITEEVRPTLWYGKQHPFEFEVVVANDPAVHKIFDNLELIANKAKPESFHYEIVGEAYDFAKDKPNMYFRLEARKALWQYNGADICYNRDFLKVNLRLQNKSADFPHKYYSRKDTVNEIEDYYLTSTTGIDKYDYKHLAGAELVYYSNRLEFRIWNHVPAVAMSDLLDTTNHWDSSCGITILKSNTNERNPETMYDNNLINSYSGGRSIIGANCEYLEDRWKIQINPLIVCYRNEFTKSDDSYLFSFKNSDWVKNSEGKPVLPKIPIYNSPIPNEVMEKGELTYPFITNLETGEINSVVYPKVSDAEKNALYGLYSKYINEESWEMLDTNNWITGTKNTTSWSNPVNRKETDIRDRFIKVRVRYSGEELAIIDYLNTLYRVSYS